MESANDTVAIIGRFGDAIDRLKADKVIRGLQTVTNRYGINRRNFQVMRNSPSEFFGRFRPAWIMYLVRDYHVNPYWLLLGEGEFYSAGFSAEIVKKLNGNCTKKS